MTFAPNTSTYITMTPDPTDLPNSQYLAVGAGLSLTSGGFGGAYTLNTSGTLSSLAGLGTSGIVIFNDQTNTFTTNSISVDSSLNLTNPNGIGGSPTFSVVPQMTVQRIQASANGGSIVGNYPTLNFIGAGNASVAVTSNPSANRLDITISATEEGAGTVTSVGLSTSTLALSGTNPVTTSGTIGVNLPATGVTPGAYLNTNLTVDAYGRIIAASDGSTSGGVDTVVGTANQITANTVSGDVTLSLPSTLIAPGTFEAITSVTTPIVDLQDLNIDGAAGVTGEVPTRQSDGSLAWELNAGGLASVTGTADQITANTVGDAVTLSFPSTNNGLIFPKNIITSAGGVGNDSNVCFGPNTGNALTTGADNVLIGADAGAAITTGIGNICIGFHAGLLLTTQLGNFFAGYNAGESCNDVSSNYNVGWGDGALTSLVTGSYNTTLGKDTGITITSGSNNLILGYNAQTTTPTTSNQIVFGDNSVTTLSIPGLGIDFGISTANTLLAPNLQTLTLNATTSVTTPTLTIDGVSRTYTLPVTDGTPGQTIQWPGSGTQLIWASESGTGTVTDVATGTGLTGGPITTTGTISLADTAVTPGSYTNADITVDAQGRITLAANGSGPIGLDEQIVYCNVSENLQTQIDAAITGSAGTSSLWEVVVGPGTFTGALGAAIGIDGATDGLVLNGFVNSNTIPTIGSGGNSLFIGFDTTSQDITVSNFYLNGAVACLAEGDNYFNNVSISGELQIFNSTPANLPGNYTFKDCVIGDQITVDAGFTGNVIFNNCDLTAAVTTSFAQTGATKVKFINCRGMPTTPFTNVTYEGTNVTTANVVSAPALIFPNTTQAVNSSILSYYRNDKFTDVEFSYNSGSLVGDSGLYLERIGNTVFVTLAFDDGTGTSYVSCNADGSDLRINITIPAEYLPDSYPSTTQVAISGLSVFDGSNAFLYNLPVLVYVAQISSNANFIITPQALTTFSGGVYASTQPAFVNGNKYGSLQQFPLITGSMQFSYSITNEPV